MRLLLLGLTLLMTPLLANAQPACPSGNLLAGKRPVKSRGVTSAVRLTDRTASIEGGNWNTAYTAVLKGSTSFVTYDLGQVVTFDGLFLQGDNNDTYEFSVSDDGVNFNTIWKVPVHPKAGMRMRLRQGINAQGRYLKVGNAVGDKSYSIGELAAYCKQPAIWPPALEYKGAAPVTNLKDARKHRMARFKIIITILGGLAIIALMLRRRYPDAQYLAPITAVAITALMGFILWACWREQRGWDSAWTKMALMAVVLAVGWAGYYMNKWAHLRLNCIWFERGALLFIVFASANAWVNYGTFHGTKVVHYWDSFHYYIGGKYFPENKYHLIYHCSAIAELDDGRGEEFGDRQIRDLRNNALGPAKPVIEAPEECRTAFTPERWQAFRQDLRLFRTYMGSAWWQKMFKDHGFNATPVWILVGNIVTNIGWEGMTPPDELINSPANLKGRSYAEKKEIKERFTQDKKAFAGRIFGLAMIDFGLYAMSFLLIWWAFGFWGLGFAALIWGTGYPWSYFWTGGSFGRTPWLFMSVAGVCFMKRGWSALGGAGITWAMLLRVFPGALIVGVSLKIGWNLITKKFISRSHIKLIAGCALALAILVGSSLPVVDGFDSYTSFIGNSFKHKGTHLTNHMGLPTLMSYRPKDVGRMTRNNKLDDPFAVWKVRRSANIKSLKWLQATLLLLFAGLLIFLSKRMEDWELTAMSGLFIVGIFELTCYYYTFMILMALMALKRIRYAVTFLVMCIVGQILQMNIGWYDEQYVAESLVIIVAQLILLFGFSWELFKTGKIHDQFAEPEEAEESDSNGEPDEAPATA